MSGSEATETVSISWHAAETLTWFSPERLCALLPLVGARYHQRLGEVLDGCRYIGADVTWETTTIRVSDQPVRPDDLRLPDDDDKAGSFVACFVALSLVRMLELHGVQGLERVMTCLQAVLDDASPDPPDPLDDADEEDGT